MVMEKYYIQDQMHELLRKINSLHLSYLEIEESPEKLKQREKLEDCISNYLCHVPHNQKFKFLETAEVLYKSANSKKDFSGYKAAIAMDTIGRYAANLITKPWRREYRQIKMYSGFYKHHIESNLLGAEVMFEAMGYRKYKNELLILEGPISLERVTSVSLDSLIAYEECKILKTIWEEVSSVFNISWLEVLKFRMQHLCSPKQSITSLIYLQHQRQYEQKNANYGIYDGLSHNTKLLQQTMYPTLPPHMHMVPAPPACMYQANGFCGGYIPYAPPAFPYMPVNYVTPYKYNTVPTAQLIELDQHSYGNTENRRVLSKSPVEYDEPDYKYCYDSKKQPTSDSKVSDKEEGSGTYESWDYVYRNLESQGYSKDLGERGDLLLQPIENEKFKNPKKISEKSTIKDKRKLQTASVYDNLPQIESKKEVKNNGNLTKTNVKCEAKVDKGNKKDTKECKGWQCATCTFLNPDSKTICEICGKTKNCDVEELKVGGAECVKCTYINPKEKKVCDVCSASLDEKAPTYV